MVLPLRRWPTWISFVQDRIEKLAKDLFDDFVKRLNGEPVLGLCVLKGGYRFFTDLVSKLGPSALLEFFFLPPTTFYIRNLGMFAIRQCLFLASFYQVKPYQVLSTINLLPFYTNVTLRSLSSIGSLPKAL